MAHAMPMLRLSAAAVLLLSLLAVAPTSAAYHRGALAGTLTVLTGLDFRTGDDGLDRDTDLCTRYRGSRCG